VNKHGHYADIGKRDLSFIGLRMVLWIHSPTATILWAIGWPADRDREIAQVLSTILGVHMANDEHLARLNKAIVAGETAS
jgi:hypothetical protein